MSHAFYKTVDWELVRQSSSTSLAPHLSLSLQLKLRQLTPPYKPRIDSDRDPSNFDPQFVVEPTEFTPDDQ